MKVKVSKRGDWIEADPIELPGSPAVGRGRTIAEAFGDFLIHYQKQLGLDVEVDESAKQAEQERREQALSQR